MKRIKVLEVIRQGQFGGGESHLIDLINSFEEKIQPIVLSFSKGQMIDTLSKRNIKCYVIESNSPFNPFIQKDIIKIIKEERIQIIHAHGSRAASNMLLTSWINKIPMVYTVHGWSFHPDQNIIINTLRKYSEKIICSACKEVICVSQNNKKYGIKEFGLSSTSRVIENGIDFNKFNIDKSKDIRQSFGFTEKDFIIGFIGRITQQKAPYCIVDSIAIAHKQNSNIKGLIIGDGDMKNEIKNYISRHNYNDFILLKDARNDIPDILSTIDVYALPSLWEGLSIGLLEAMAMKKAIVATPTDGTRDLIKDNENGKIVPFNNAYKLAQAYIEYNNNNLEKSKLGEMAYSSIKDKFDSKRVAIEVTNIYNTLLS